jgi:hypothetical protein
MNAPGSSVPLAMSVAAPAAGSGPDPTIIDKDLGADTGRKISNRDHVSLGRGYYSSSCYWPTGLGCQAHQGEVINLMVFLDLDDLVTDILGAKD